MLADGIINAHANFPFRLPNPKTWPGAKSSLLLKGESRLEGIYLQVGSPPSPHAPPLKERVSQIRQFCLSTDELENSLLFIGKKSRENMSSMWFSAGVQIYSSEDFGKCFWILLSFSRWLSVTKHPARHTRAPGNQQLSCLKSSSTAEKHSTRKQEEQGISHLSFVSGYVCVHLPIQVHVNYYFFLFLN